MCLPCTLKKIITGSIHFVFIHFCYIFDFLLHVQSLFDGDKMKRLAKHRWPVLGAKSTFGKVLERKNA